MLPKQHFFASFILMLIIWPFFGFWSFFIFLGGVFIDIDHYLRYIWIKKEWNLKNAYNYFKNRGNYGSSREIYIFHTLETMIVLIILLFFHKLFFIVLLGWILHMCMDSSYDKKRNQIEFGKRLIFTDLIVKCLFHINP